MKVSLALAVFLLVGFCEVYGDPILGQTRYRCPVKDKFLRRDYSFRGFPGVGSWQECGEYNFFLMLSKSVFPLFFSGLLCQRYNGGGDDPRCEFWSITPQPSGLCLLFSEGADEYPQDYPGAFSGERQCVD